MANESKTLRLMELMREFITDGDWTVKENVKCDDGTTRDVLIASDGWLYIERWNNLSDSEAKIIEFLGLLGNAMPEILSHLEDQDDFIGDDSEDEL